MTLKLLSIDSSERIVISCKDLFQHSEYVLPRSSGMCPDEPSHTRAVESSSGSMIPAEPESGSTAGYASRFGEQSLT